MYYTISRIISQPQKSVETMSDVAMQHKYHCRATSSTKGQKMNKILHSIYCFMESMGRARAASTLARHGKHDLARQIILERSQCCNG